MTPRFSIITCTRNSMATLRETVDSVTSQTFTDYEHVFVDGGSTDGTLEYLEGLRGNVRIVRDSSGGISKAMNDGVEAASGQIVCHLHSDDYFIHSRVLARVDAALRQRPAKWLFGRILSDIDGGLFPETYRIPRYSHARILKGNFIPHPAMFVARDAFLEVGGFECKLKYAMDYDLILKLAARHEPVQLSEALTAFRRHEGSTTQLNWLASYDEQYAVRKTHIARQPTSALVAMLRYHYWRTKIRYRLKAAA